MTFVSGSDGDIGFSAGLCGTADGPEYWEHLGQRHLEHRRHVRNLLVICALIAIAAAVVHPAVLGLGAIVVPLLLVEKFAAHRSRPPAAT